MSSEFNYISVLIEIMETIEKDYEHSQMFGEEKKNKAIELFKQTVIHEFGEEHWLLKFEPMIPTLIDFIVNVSKNDIKLQLNKVKRCCFGIKKK